MVSHIIFKKLYELWTIIGPITQAETCSGTRQDDVLGSSGTVG